MTSEIDSILGDIENSDSSFISDIKKYWRIITAFDDFKDMIASPLTSVKKKMPNVPEEEWDKFIEEFNIPAMEGDHINQIMQHFTHEEVKAIIKLYEDHPILKKTIETTKIIREESYKLTEKWLNKFNSLLMTKIDQWGDMGYLELE